MQALAATLATAAKTSYCYFNNDVEAAAVLDALELAELVGCLPM
jgi:uncharacterized protein YecE (DUF72 family)